jgi:hypothetical protein
LGSRCKPNTGGRKFSKTCPLAKRKLLNGLFLKGQAEPAPAVTYPGPYMTRVLLMCVLIL